jgi:hypothetical protein
MIVMATTSVAIVAVAYLDSQRSRRVAGRPKLTVGGAGTPCGSRTTDVSALD